VTGQRIRLQEGMSRLLLVLFWLSGLLPLGAARAEEAATCPSDADLIEENSWLRAMSLDLRGAPPTPDEYARVSNGDDPGRIAEEWMQTEDFAWQVVRHHRELLWPNVSDIRLLSNRQRLSYSYEIEAYWRYLVAPEYRGGPVHCGDFEARWDEDGELITVTDEDGYTREGWTWVTPYWNPTHQVRVCAFEAQEARVSPWGTECDTNDGRYDPHCGCGPNLAWCDTYSLGHNGNNPNPPVAASIVGDLEHRIARVVEQDLSYLEMLTGQTMFVNGPLVHFYRYQTRVPAHIRFNEVPVDPARLPDLEFTDVDTWVELELGEEHSGILTSTAYLMKFQTRRARTNRFFTAFLCQPFQPPDGGLTDLDSPDATLDLSVRDGCKYCHAILEPAGAHWGRWSEYGAGYLSPDDFPAWSDDCAWCAESGESCSAECRTYYVTEPLSSEEDPWVGYLQSYEFLEERHEGNVEEGPARLVASTVQDGRLQTCVARNTATWLLGRAPGEVEEAWVAALASDFAASGFDYKHLVHSIITDERYRRVR